MARTLDQILSEVDTAYAPQRASIQQQQAQLIPQEQAQEAGLNATKDSAFNDILSGARQRGIGFSGIPLGEQAKYVATTYLPAVANLKQSFNQQNTSLSDALNGLTSQENQYAQSIRQAELDRDQQAAQFQQQLAASRANAAASVASPSFAMPSAAQASPQVIPKNGKNGAGGFAFRDATGKTISAAQYAQLSGTAFGDLLHQMASQGDAYAAQAYNQIKANQAYYNAHPDVLRNEFKYLF